MLAIPNFSYSRLYFSIELRRQKSVKRHFTAVHAKKQINVSVGYMRVLAGAHIPPYKNVLLLFIAYLFKKRMRQ